MIADVLQVCENNNTVAPKCQGIIKDVTQNQDLRPFIYDDGVGFMLSLWLRLKKQDQITITKFYLESVHI